MILCAHSAYCGMPNSFFEGPSENPKLGSDGATTWKDGPSLASVRSERILTTSRKLPGPVRQCQSGAQSGGAVDNNAHPWQNNKGMLSDLLLFWWMKWMSRLPKPSTGILVM